MKLIRVDISLSIRHMSFTCRSYQHILFFSQNRKDIVMKKLLMLIICSIFFTNSNAGSLKECDSESCKAYFKKFEKGAKGGHGQAIAMLGEFYYHGYGVAKDSVKALGYYTKAAKKGITSAEYKAGLIYLLNEDFKDLDKGIYFLTKAARAEYKDALFLLGRIYLTDEFKLKNLNQADIYLAKAYKKKHVNMPETLMYIMNTYSSVDEEVFPALHKVVENAPLVLSNKKLHWPDTDTEIITITSAKIETIFDIQLKEFRRPIKSVGSRLPGVTCEETVGCITAKNMQELGDMGIL